MGGGKGSVEMYVAPVLPGRMLFEITGVPENMAREALGIAAYKFPVKTRIVSSADLM
jgi:large subunit ribosomal protein L16